MADPIQKTEEENIVIRTMKGDLGGSTAKPKDEKPEPPPVFAPVAPLKETEYKAPQAPVIIPPTPAPAPAPSPAPLIAPPISKLVQPDLPVMRPVPPAPIASKLPTLNVAPKTLPEKSPYKTTPTWIKLGLIGLGVIILALSSLYGYWKIFIQSKAPAVVPPAATSTAPTLPTAPTTPAATSTAPIKFFNKLPNKTITIDLPSKTSAVLVQALKSEAKITETRSSIKQIKITYQGKPLTAEDFFKLMLITTPQDFLLNYENEFVFAYFSQKEGARPILILKAKDRKLAQDQMTEWEKTALAKNIFPIFLSNTALLKTFQPFKSYLFINQPVRYLNIGVPFASLNYAIYNDFLIFTSSSAGMFVVLQDLTGQIVSQNYLDNLNASIETFVK